MTDAVEPTFASPLGAPVPSIRVWVNEFETTDFIAGGEILADKRAREAAEKAAQEGSAS